MYNKVQQQAIFMGIFFILFTSMILSQNKKDNSAREKGKSMNEKVVKSKNEWKQVLTDEQYRVIREKGTERPFTGEYWNSFDEGEYKCAACGETLFDSKTKFDAGCGWPSFSDVINNNKIITKTDYSFGMHRIEVMCGSCEGHLGHIFDDGPKPTGQRYCINSVSIKFVKKSK